MYGMKTLKWCIWKNFDGLRIYSNYFTLTCSVGGGFLPSIKLLRPYIKINIIAYQRQMLLVFIVICKLRSDFEVKWRGLALKNFLMILSTFKFCVIGKFPNLNGKYLLYIWPYTFNLEVNVRGIACQSAVCIKY